MLYSAGPKYVLNRTCGALPLLVPGLEYVEEVLVSCTDPVRLRAAASALRRSGAPCPSPRHPPCRALSPRTRWWLRAPARRAARREAPDLTARAARARRAQMGGADSVKITVCSRGSCMPVLSAVIKMPLSEVALE